MWYCRILTVIESVAESIPITDNKTAEVTFESFSIFVQEVDTKSFSGYEFSVPSENSLPPGDISLPANIFDNLTDSNSTTRRITSAVFYRDTLFSMQNDSNLVVGGVILSASLAGTGNVENLDPPVSITFQKDPSVTNATNPAECRFWDFLLDG